MGEAAPPQPPAGSFVPLLGGVPGPGNGSRGSAVPQLHSAIVERLRARIELCRRHHTSCENRYQRGQAESSDRERESTLQLLNIVHQGPGSRKTKHGKAASQPQQALAPPPQSHEFNGRANGEQKPQRPAGAPEEEHRNPTRIAVFPLLHFSSSDIVLSCAGHFYLLQNELVVMFHQTLGMTWLWTRKMVWDLGGGRQSCIAVCQGGRAHEFLELFYQLNEWRTLILLLC
ncbi:MAML2 protein, partial [Polypterus senegalus]|nr:MAML2 protein [Polypterus senegalus]